MQHLDPLSSKYFKLVVDNNSIKKDTAYEISANCPVCGDKKHRLHLYRPDNFEQDVVHCFNEGCSLAEKHHNVINFLKIAGPEFIESYKRENFHNNIKEIKGQKSLNSVIEKVEKNRLENKENSEIPLEKFFKKCKDHPECRKYCLKRGIEPKDDWFFSESKFFEYNGKKVFLENYLLIPIYNNNLYKGFYSRNIKEKSFSTFLLPDTEKIWFNHNTDINNVQIICEGIFDALSTGFEKCSAMISASVSEKVKQELKINTDVIFAFDNDKTGIKKAIKIAEEGFRVFVPPDIWKFKDFNEALINGISKEDIQKTIKENVYSGILAITKLKMKEI